jgi:hypothetical protein
MINLPLTPDELDVLRKVLEGEESDDNVITTLLDRVNDLSIAHEHPGAAEAVTTAPEPHTD